MIEHLELGVIVTTMQFLGKYCMNIEYLDPSGNKLRVSGI